VPLLVESMSILIGSADDATGHPIRATAAL
jgi:hypothetical protein